MKIEKILVHVDPDALSETLLSKVKRLAQSRKVLVELFYCGYNHALHNAYRFDAKSEQHAISGFLNDKEEKLAKISDLLVSEGIHAGYDVTWCRNMAEGVIRKAQRMQADVLVVEMELGTQTAGYLLSQGQWQLIAQCPIPVLITRGDEWVSAHPRLASAVDPFHQCDEPALLDHEIVSVSRYLAASLSAELHLVHCFSSMPHSAIFNEHLTLDYEQFHKDLRVQHSNRLNQLIENEKLQEIVPHLLEGEVQEVIPELVSSHSIDILVMGTLARGFLDRLLVGSTVERVINRTACDLLLVKQPGFVSPITE